MFLYFWMMMQVIGENLPISSSGHVALLHAVADKYQFSIDSLVGIDVWKFDYLLQGVSAILFLIYFFKPWWKLIIAKPIELISLCDVSVWKKIFGQVFIFGFVADGITFLFWLTHIDQIIYVPLALGFIITAGALWSIQFAHEKHNVDIWSLRNGSILGLVQGCALLPGISRFGTTFAALKWLGYRNDDAFSISFLVQWPLIVAGSLVGYKALYDDGIMHEILNSSFLMITLLTGVLAYGVLACVQKIIDKNLFWKFSYYMIIPIMVALFL